MDAPSGPKQELNDREVGRQGLSHGLFCEVAVRGVLGDPVRRPLWLSDIRFGSSYQTFHGAYACRAVARERCSHGLLQTIRCNDHFARNNANDRGC